MSLSFGVVNVVGVEVFGDSLSHGWRVEVDPVRVVDDTVENGVGDGWLANEQCITLSLYTILDRACHFGFMPRLVDEFPHRIVLSRRFVEEA